MSEQNTDARSLAHTKWVCKYHVVFAPKYRRKVFFEEKREDIRDILRKLCEWKGVEILEGEVCPDHVHLLFFLASLISAFISSKLVSGRFFACSHKLQYAFLALLAARFDSEETAETGDDANDF